LFIVYCFLFIVLFFFFTSLNLNQQKKGKTMEKLPFKFFMIFFRFQEVDGGRIFGLQYKDRTKFDIDNQGITLTIFPANPMLQQVK